MENKDRSLKKPELLAPAGDWAALTSAIDSGADAVYFGAHGLSMRQAAGNFDILELYKVMDAVRAAGIKGYLTLNVIVYQDELTRARKVLEAAAAAGVDAVILWDMAVMSICRDMGLEMHLSTQASVSNFEALKAYAGMGVKRVVLARECTLDNIARIADSVKAEDIECGIETFVHGAMCVSLSGRCFLSQDVFKRSANRGECIQPCRREYLIKDIDGECEFLLGKDYVLSPRDMCTVDMIDEMMAAGIDSFKIEGRMRSPEYVSTVTKSYRSAIDSVLDGTYTENKKKELLSSLKNSFNRGFSRGFFEGGPDDLAGKLSRDYTKTYIGEVLKYYRKIGVAEVKLSCAGIRRGQELLITGKKTPAGYFIVENMEIEHEAVDEVPRGGAVGIKVPFEVRRKDKVFLWERNDAAKGRS